MAERGISVEVAEDIYEKILAFSSYGFPESHAISFAYLVYASAWLKRYFPAAFTTALLRNQPMGFYAPHSLINDARRHGVVVRGVDVNASDALATLEGSSPPAIRLGLSAVRNLGSQAAERVAAGRPYRDLEDFATRTHLPAAALEALLVERGVITSDAVDAVVDVFEHEVGPQNGARVVARAWAEACWDCSGKFVIHLGLRLRGNRLKHPRNHPCGETASNQ